MKSLAYLKANECRYPCKQITIEDELQTRRLWKPVKLWSTVSTGALGSRERWPVGICFSAISCMTSLFVRAARFRPYFSSKSLSPKVSLKTVPLLLFPPTCVVP
jgi:hypothetical protein